MEVEDHEMRKGALKGEIFKLSIGFCGRFMKYDEYDNWM